MDAAADDAAELRAELEACQARDRWPRDYVTPLIAALIGLTLGALLVLALPARLKCRLRCT